MYLFDSFLEKLSILEDLVDFFCENGTLVVDSNSSI